MPIEFLEFEPINPLLSKCQVKVCYVGDEPNRNGSIITKETAKELAASVPGSPIVGYYNEETEDFEEHNRVIEIKNGKLKIKDTTRPYGFVPTNAKVWFQWFEDDGVPHEYLMTEGVIWTGQYPESQRVLEKGNNQSMELDENTLNAFWTKDDKGKPQFFIINEAIMSKLCILGEDVEPCFEGASIGPVKFSLEDDFKEKVFSMIEKMQEILSNEGGTTPVLTTYAVEIGCHLWDAIYEYVWANFNDRWNELSLDGVYEEDNQKFAILRNRKDLTLYRLNFSYDDEAGFQPAGELIQVSSEFAAVNESQFAKEEVEAYEVKFAESKQEKVVEEEPVQEEPVVEEPAQEEEPAVEEPVQEEEPATEQSVQEEPVVESRESEENQPVAYNLEEVTEYQELLVKYAALENQVAELNNRIEALTAENATLIEFKLGIDREKKQELINSFYMLSDDLKKDCQDNINTYSYDEIEAKLSIICVRNKVSFDLDQPKEDKPVTYNIDSTEDEYAGLPAWVKRTKQVEKEMNL